MIRPKLSIEDYRWNKAISGGKNKSLLIVNAFPNKEKLFELFEALGQQLIDYKQLINQYDFKNHQDWISGIFAILVNIDDIIIKYEAAEEPSNSNRISICDRLKEEADMLDEISGMPILQYSELDDNVDEKIEIQYQQVRKAIYAVHDALLEAIPW